MCCCRSSCSRRTRSALINALLPQRRRLSVGAEGRHGRISLELEANCGREPCVVGAECRSHCAAGWLMLLSAVLRCHYYAALSTLLLTGPKWLQLNARCCCHVTAVVVDVRLGKNMMPLPHT